jgi:hypothetical protein
MHILDTVKYFVNQPSVTIDDPTYDWFMLYIDFNSSMGLFAPESSENSAIAYLRRTGEKERANGLAKARQLLKDILERAQYRVLKVDGLDALYNNLKKVGAESELSVTMLETMNWEIRFIAFNIFEALYDQYRQLDILPSNLRRFAMSLYFADIHFNPDSNDDGIHALNAPDYVQYSNESWYSMNKTNDFVGRQNVMIHMPYCFIDMNPMLFNADNTDQSDLPFGFKFMSRWSYFTAVFPLMKQIAYMKTDKTEKTNFAKIDYDTANAGGYSSSLGSAKLTTSMQDFATSVVLGQFAALRMAGTSYLNNALGSLSDSAIVSKAKQAYDILLKPGFTQAAIESELNALLERSDHAYIRQLSTGLPGLQSYQQYNKSLGNHKNVTTDQSYPKTLRSSDDKNQTEDLTYKTRIL